jgi:hypothetical protein
MGCDTVKYFYTSEDNNLSSQCHESPKSYNSKYGSDKPKCFKI